MKQISDIGPLNTLEPEMSEEDVRKAVEPLMLEYFENRDCEEVLFSLEQNWKLELEIKN